MDLTSLRMIVCGGAAVPRVADRAVRAAPGVSHRPGMGDDRDGPARRAGVPAEGRRPETEELDWRARTGRVMPGVELRIVDETGALPWDGDGGRRDRGARAVGDGALLPRRRAREVRRRLAAHRRRRQRRRARLHPDHRPHEGRHQVGRRVDLVGRPRERRSWPPGRRRGRGDRRARRAVDGAAAGVRRRATATTPPRPTSCARTSSSASRAGGCPSAGRSSTRSRRRASASSTRS